LLEVGTGFHPELTGRENIFLNGAILGMRKAEIKSKFDEIVSFSGVEKYIDTPVKRYSSGMYVRLAFAVAAYLESEILIVDEVLAVGDAEFQKKCLGKMRNISHGEGRTILFVSHNMTAIQRLCNSAILMHQGKIIKVGETNHIIDTYLQDSTLSKSVYDIPVPEMAAEIPGYAYKLQIEDENNNVVNEICVGRQWQVRVFFKLTRRTDEFIIALGIITAMEVNLRTSWSGRTNLDEGYYEAVFKETNLILSAGKYYLVLGLSSREKTFHYEENVAILFISEITDQLLDETIIRTNNTSLMLNPMSITIKKSL
jgi:lipopolysaccharide transport system ATP-binding protein